MPPPSTPSLNPIDERLPWEWKLAIVMMLSAALLMSGLFDSFWIQVMGQPEVPRELRKVIAGFFTLLLVIAGASAWTHRVPAWWRPRSKAPWDWALKAILWAAPAWFIIGVVNSWPMTYVLGDLFLLTILPITYFTMTRRPLANPKVVFGWLYGLMILTALLSVGLIVYHNILVGARDKMSIDSALGPIFYIMLKNRASPWEILLLPILVIASLLTTKRSTWAGIIMVFAVAMAMKPGIRRSFRIALTVLGGVILVYIAMQYRPELVEHSHISIERRWAETVHDLSGREGSDLAPGGGGRAGEVFGVFDTINARQNPVDWVAGLGLGAIVQARGGRERHHVHSTPAAFLARTGSVGLVLWSAFSLIVWWQLLRYTLNTREKWLRTQFAFWLGIWSMGLVFSAKSLAFWGSVPAAIQVAYFLHLMRIADVIKNQEDEARQAEGDAVRRKRPRVEVAP
ncbi:MAG: hypothetical protein JJU11_15540 [Candidatus Sumerlaeia bacterium]|nr:hypothetical protein [Candidatus Sumerlaeia bacterium]